MVSANHRTVSWLAFIPGVASILILLYGVSEKSRHRTDPAERPPLTLRPFGWSFRYFLIVLVLFTLGNSSDAFLILKAREAGVSIVMVPILWMVLHVSKTLSATPGGILADRMGRRQSIIAGWILYGGVYLGFAFTDQAEMIWILFALYGFYYGLMEGGERALVAELVPLPFRGAAYGLYPFAIGISTLPASLLMGFLWERVGLQGAFTVGAVLAFSAAVLPAFLKNPEV